MMRSLRAIGHPFVMLTVLAKTFAFHGFVGMYLQSGNLMHTEFARNAISSDRLQSWASAGSGRLPIDQDAIRLNDQINTTHDEMSTSDLDEVQILLACRAYLSKKNKLKWKGKKVRRREAAISNVGFFWHNPDDLVYLRESPEPYNSHDNQADDEAFSKAYNLHLAGTTPTIREKRVEYSTNPFSTTPLYPSEEHIKRSKSRAHLWLNETWKDSWYEKRWEGKKVTDAHIKRKKAKRRIENLPSNIMSEPEFTSLSEAEVLNATLSYIRTREKMSEAKKKLQRDRLAQRAKHKEALAALRKEGEEMARLMKTNDNTKHDIVERTPPLSFDPPANLMASLQAERTAKAKRAYRNRKPTANKQKQFKQKYSIGNDKSAQALLRINDCLDDDELPSIDDVQTILKPGRLGRRRAILRRILDDCFGLKGKCVPRRETGHLGLQFTTTCSIQDLGDFVLEKLKRSSS